MPESNNKTNAPVKARRETFVEKLVRRTLTSVGGVFDRATGRSGKKNDLPSTNDLSERLKRLIDAGARLAPDGRKIAPHYIRLKYAWGQTSEEFLTALKRLDQELLVVAIDHVNDNRYRTLAPVKVEAKADILTTGFALSVGFDAGDAAQSEQVEIPAEIFASLIQIDENAGAPGKFEIAATATINLPGRDEREISLKLAPDGKTHLTVGRSKDNPLFLDDASVSKHHASLVMTGEAILRVADTGSTNGTFINGERIAYGKAYDVTPADKVAFGSVAVRFAWETPRPPEIIEEQTAAEQIAINNDSSEQKPDFQIEVDSVEATAQNAEPQTDFGESAEPETVFGSPAEPETAVGKTIAETKPLAEPETVAGKSAAEIVRSDGETPEPATVFGNSAAPPQSAPKISAEASGKESDWNDFYDSMIDGSPAARPSPGDAPNPDE